MSAQLIDVHALKQLMDSNKTILIDVRELNEWEEMHIPNAIHIPKGRLLSEIPALIPDFNQPIYLHCAKGLRSQNAAQQLCDMGYKEVYSLKDGILEWERAHYPVIRKS